MIGKVKQNLEPYVRLWVGGTQEGLLELDALVDTGFNQWLAISKSLQETIGGEYLYTADIGTAGGPIPVSVYLIWVRIDGVATQVGAHVLPSEMNAIGTLLMEDKKLTIDFISDGVLELTTR